VGVGGGGVVGAGAAVGVTAAVGAGVDVGAAVGVGAVVAAAAMGEAGVVVRRTLTLISSDPLRSAANSTIATMKTNARMMTATSCIVRRLLRPNRLALGGSLLGSRL
jgi:hypothetical protein